MEVADAMSDALASLRARIDAEKARRADTGIPYCPEKPSPPQAAFLALETREAFYGGAAGGGKSSALLMDMLRFAKRPGFSGLILRRTMTDLAMNGAIMDRAKMWLLPHVSAGVTWNANDKFFTFPTEGRPAKLQFGYAENLDDVVRHYQGAEFHREAIDELTQWDEPPAQYLTTRLRRQKWDPIPLGFRGAGNPGGRGHKWVKKRYVQPGHPDRPFIPALAKDNPGLKWEEYVEQLGSLDETTKAQLRDGIWIDDGAGLVYRYDEQRNAVLELPSLRGWQAVLAVDLGASESKPTTAFCIVMWSPDSPVAYAERCWAEAALTPTTIAERIQQVRELLPEARIVMDVGALGTGYANEIRARYAIPIIPAQKKDKLGFRKLMNGALERAELMVCAPDCPMLVDELTSLVWDVHGLDNDKTQPNHCTDALLYGWREAQSWRSAFIKPEPVYSEEERLYRKEREQWENRKKSQGARW